MRVSAECQPIGIRRSVKQHLAALKETLLPYQTISGVSWLFAGICSAGTIPRVFSDESIFLVICCVVCARCSGMCWNRLVDVQFDAKNPRTSFRALPSHKMRHYQMALYALFFLGLFLVACLFFPPSQRIFGVSVAIAVVLYSFLKRWSVLCHFFLGGLYALLPIVGALWQTNAVTIPSVCFAIAAFCSVSGCDILYALQDEQFDRRVGLYSLPVKLGSAKALEVASSIHAIAFVCITQGLFYAHVVALAYVSWGIGAVILLVKWHQLWTGRVQRVGEAFSILLSGFSFSTVVSLVLDCAWKTLL